MLKKKDLLTETARQLWEDYFGFLEEKKKDNIYSLLGPAPPLNNNKSSDKNTQNLPSATIITSPAASLSASPSKPEAFEKEQIGDEIFMQISQQFNPSSDAEKSNGSQDNIGPKVIVPVLSSLPNVEELFKEQDALFSPSTSPTLHDIVKYMKHQGVVGEEHLSVAATLALVNHRHFGIEGYSGSGKTFITDKLVSLIADRTYQFGLSSEQAAFRDAEQINLYEFLYISELQKAMTKKNSAIVEAIKDLTEGKDAFRKVTSSNKKNVDELRINSGITIIYTLALENYFKKDEESSRRFLRLKTDNSPEHIEEIHQTKAERRYQLKQAELVQEGMFLEEQLKKHFVASLSLEAVKIMDPFANYILELMPKTQKSAGYIDHYLGLVDACVKFNAPQRTKLEFNGQPYLLANVEDHFTVHTVYHDQYVRTLKEFAERQDASDDNPELQMFSELTIPDWAECYHRGIRIVLEDEQLEEMVQENIEKVIHWSECQKSNGKLLALDHLSGKMMEIADLSKIIEQPAQLELFDTNGRQYA